MPKAVPKSFSFVFALIACFCACALSSAHAKTIKSEEGRFSIEMPGQPKFSRTPQRFQWTLEQGRMFWAVSYQDAPGMSKRSSREVYDRLQTAHSKNNTLLNSRDIQYRGWKGREVVIRIASDKILRMRFFIAGDRLYAIFYGGPPLTERVKEVDAFFASLRLYAR